VIDIVSSEFYRFVDQFATKFLDKFKEYLVLPLYDEAFKKRYD
jgi:hypothetical protein